MTAISVYKKMMCMCERVRLEIAVSSDHACKEAENKL